MVSEEMTVDMSTMQHAASQVPSEGASCTLDEEHGPGDQRAHLLEQQRRRSVHYSLVPFLEILDEIKDNRHLQPTRGSLCRNPDCDCYAHEDVAEFGRYCCKQCALRRREKDKGIVHHNPRSFQIAPHGLHCQGHVAPGTSVLARVVDAFGGRPEAAQESNEKQPVMSAEAVQYKPGEVKKVNGRRTDVPHWHTPMPTIHEGEHPRPPSILNTEDVTEQQYDRFLHLMDVNGWDFEFAVMVLGQECVEFPRGHRPEQPRPKAPPPQPLQMNTEWRSQGHEVEPHKYKAPPPEPRWMTPADIAALTDDEVRGKYRQVILDHLQRVPPNPLLRNFQYGHLSKVEKIKYDEEREKIEAEQLLLAKAISVLEVSRNQNTSEVVPDEKNGIPVTPSNQDVSGRGGPSIWGPPDWRARGGEVGKGGKEDSLQTADPWSKTADGVGIKTSRQSKRRQWQWSQWWRPQQR